MPLVIRAPLLLFLLLVAVSWQPARLGAQTFATGATSNTFVVPANTTRIRITAKGADGGLAAGGNNGPGEGALVIGTFDVTPGDLIRFVVGEAGENGDEEGGGGGGTGVFIGTTLIMVAGGGGGDDNTGDGRGGRSVTSGGTG
ncbi:MAG: hypothetical protein AAFP99_10950, partial [Pseudomonadota bacterium]